MRIVHLSKFYPPSRGGLEDIVAKLATGAASRGHEVHVICGVGPDEDPKSSGQTEFDGVTVHRLPTTATIWSQPLIKGYVSAAGMRADVVHTHHPHPLADVATVRSVRAPIVITHHSDIRRQALVRPIVNLFARPVRRRAAAICVPTRSHITVSEELPHFESKCRIVPFGVDEKIFHPDAGPIPRAFEGDDPVALFVGRLVGYKGLPVLLDAVEGTELRVVVAGTGPLQEWLESQVQERRLHDNVELAGLVPDRELPAYYAAASYFVLPSTSAAEMFGVCLIEAMASGTPIITTDLPTGVSEVNAPGEVGLSVPMGDPLALRAAMRKLAGDAGLRSRFGEAARKRTLEKFSLTRMVEEQLAVYEDVAS